MVHSGSDGSLVLVVCEDVTSVRELTSTLRHQAGHDPLTGLPNRRTFAQALLARLAAAKPPGPGFALLFVDLDRFKAVNDRFGHGIGDALLCAVAGRIRAELGAPDLVSRIGGDEFQVLLGDVERVGEAVARANARAARPCCTVRAGRASRSRSAAASGSACTRTTATTRRS